MGIWPDPDKFKVTRGGWIIPKEWDDRTWWQRLLARYREARGR